MPGTVYNWSHNTTGGWGTNNTGNAWNNNTSANYPGDSNTRDVAIINEGTVFLNVNASINELNIGGNATANGTLLLNQANFTLNASNGANGGCQG